MTAPDTKAIRALKSKRSKCADVGNIDLSNVPESHETIWLQWGDNGGDDDTWCVDNINDDDVPYIRADLVFALCDEIERLTKERDEAVAAAYEAAAIRSENYACGAPYNQRASINALANSLRGMTPDDAKAALEAYGREKVREGMQRAADLFPLGSRDGGSISSAILAEMETLK